jgi:hypothetical protein
MLPQGHVENPTVTLLGGGVTGGSAAGTSGGGGRLWVAMHELMQPAR